MRRGGGESVWGDPGESAVEDGAYCPQAASLCGIEVPPSEREEFTRAVNALGLVCENETEAPAVRLLLGR